MTSVLEGCPDGGAGLSSTRPEALPLIGCGAGKLPRARKVNPRYGGVDAIRRLVFPGEPKATSRSPRTEIQAVDESGKKKRKAFIASQDEEEEQFGKREISIGQEATTRVSSASEMQSTAGAVPRNTTPPLKNTQISSPEKSALTFEGLKCKDTGGGGVDSLGPLVRDCFQTVLQDVRGGHSVLRPMASRRKCSMYVFGKKPKKETRLDVNQDLLCHEC